MPEGKPSGRSEEAQSLMHGGDKTIHLLFHLQRRPNNDLDKWAKGATWRYVQLSVPAVQNQPAKQP